MMGIMDVTFLAVPPGLDGALSTTLQPVGSHITNIAYPFDTFVQHKLVRSALDAH
jgi:hypothetical protein